MNCISVFAGYSANVRGIGNSVVFDFEGRVYCWSCFKSGARETANGLHVAGRRTGNEVCATCGHAGVLIVSVVPARRRSDAR